jgi:hypothetical protein
LALCNAAHVSGYRVQALALAAIPLCFAILGMVIRYTAHTQVSPDHSLQAYMESLCRWDCFWYLDISERGYEGFPIPGESNVGRWGFFPLYPIAVATFKTLLPFRSAIVAIATSMVLTYASCLVAFQLVDRNLRAYVLYCAFVFSGPFSFYFTSVLSESLFFFIK